MKQTKTIWINGTERLLPEKNNYGMYYVCLDDKDVKALNKSQEQKNAKGCNPAQNRKSDMVITPISSQDSSAEKLIWTAEEIYQELDGTLNISCGKQFLDANEVKKIIETEIIKLSSMNNDFSLIILSFRLLLKRLGLRGAK